MLFCVLNGIVFLILVGTRREVFFSFLRSQADDQSFSCYFNHFFRHKAQGIDLHSPLNLGEQTLNQPEIAARNTNNSSNGFCVLLLAWVQRGPPETPLLLKNTLCFLGAQLTKLMHKSDARGQLWIA